MADIAGPILEAVARDQELQIVRGTVTGTSGNSVFVKRNGTESADAAPWPKCAGGAALIIGDEVLLVRTGGGYVVVDKIIR